jgi:hypothetical protein
VKDKVDSGAKMMPKESSAESKMPTMMVPKINVPGIPSPRTFLKDNRGGPGEGSPHNLLAGKMKVFY